MTEVRSDTWERRAEFRRKIEGLLDEQWDVVGPMATLDPEGYEFGADDDDYQRDLERRRCQQTANVWVLAGEAVSLTPDEIGCAGGVL